MTGPSSTAIVPSKPLRQFGIAVPALLAAIGIRLALQEALGAHFLFLTFYPAVMVSALYGGLRAGLLATILSVIAAIYFTEPVGRLAMSNPADWVATILFLLSGIVISVITETMHRARARLVASQSWLEKQVELRTEAVGQERDRLRALINSITDEVWFTDVNRHFTLANPTACNEFRLAGSQEQIDVEKLASSLEVYRPDGTPRPVEEAPPLRALKGEVIRGEEEIIRTPAHKDLRHRQISAAPVRNSRGEIIGSVSVVRDITERRRAEELLQESESRLHFALETIHTGAWDLDLIDHTAYRTLGHDAVFGYKEPLPQWTYEMFLEHVLPEDRSEVDRKFHQALATRGNWNFECRIRRADGQIRWILAAGRPIPDSSGNARRMAGIVQDITERKQAEQNLRQSEEQFRQAIEEAPIPIIMHAEDGQVLQISRGWTENTGYGPKDMDSFEAWLNRAYGAGAQAMRDHVRSLFRQEKRTMNIDFPVRTHDGSIRYWSFSASSPGILHDGRRFIVGMAVDITDRRRTEEDLRRSREDLARAQEVGSMGNWRLDVRKNELTWSDENHRIFGIPTGTPLTYEKFLSRVHPDDQFYVDTQWHAAIAGAPYDIEHRIIIGEDIRWVREKAYLEYDQNGALLGGFGITQDITARKQLEEQLSSRAKELTVANRDLEAFSYSVAHDLRNPLRTIRGFAEVLIEDCSDQANRECREYLERIKRGTDRMNSIIDDMLALSKISRQEMDLVELDLSEMARLSLNELTTANPGRQIEVKIQDGLKVRADARLLSVALSNLLGNAWKFTAGTGRPCIEFGSFNKHGKRVYFIKDNGAGFDMSLAGRLFAPFQRLHSEKEFSGTGVGLAIVERAIRRHGGRIWAEGERGKGATFFFTLS